MVAVQFDVVNRLVILSFESNTAATGRLRGYTENCITCPRELPPPSDNHKTQRTVDADQWVSISVSVVITVDSRWTVCTSRQKRLIRRAEKRASALGYFRPISRCISLYLRHALFLSPVIRTTRPSHAKKI